MKFKLAAFADEAGESLEQQISALAENGISRLEIRNVDGKCISDLSPEMVREIHRILTSYGITVWSVGSPCGKIGITEDFAPHLDQFRRTLEHTAVLGASHIRIFSFYVPRNSAENYTGQVMSRLEAFVKAAEGSGITLCHENEKEIYGDIAPRCLEIHRNFPQIKAVFDPANFVQCGQDTIAAWQMLAPYVEYMHVKDSLADGFVVPAGQGEGNLPYLLRNYKGEVLTVEPHLAVFSGFENLENSGKAHREFYCNSSSEAFAAAVSALKNLIKQEDD